MIGTAHYVMINVMKDEIESVHENEVWDLVALPEGCKTTVEDSHQDMFSYWLAEQFHERVASNIMWLTLQSKLNLRIIGANKYIDVKYISVQERFNNHLISISFVGSVDRIADPLTKALVLKVFSGRAIKWMPIQHGLELLLEVTLGKDRVGPLMSTELLVDLADLRKWKVPQALKFQEYPPGVTLVPLRSRTQRPFLTTNLVVIAADNDSEGCEVSSFAAYGDALIIDPGCHSGCHAELKDIVTALPRKLVVFVTHHHIDHIDGLSVVEKCNPDAILLAHKNTMHRIGKGYPY
ncbi:hypothetical protein ACLOJK_001284 [Asimina triloba]